MENKTKMVDDEKKTMHEEVRKELEVRMSTEKEVHKSEESSNEIINLINMEKDFLKDEKKNIKRFF